jgi:hypothetical protein
LSSGLGRPRSLRNRGNRGGEGDEQEKEHPAESYVSVKTRGRVEVWCGGVGGAYLLPTLSAVGASLAPPCCRFHTPLIEPDMRIRRIRLSEKVSRCRPRKTAGPCGETDQAQPFMENGVRKLPGRLPRDTVLATQPLTQPFASVLFHRPIGLADWP